MAREKSKIRQRIGQVSVFVHHGAHYVYYRVGGKAIRRRIGENEALAEFEASLINARLAAVKAGVPMPAGVKEALLKGEHLTTPVSVNVRAPLAPADLRTKFLDHHENVLRSSVATVDRYRAATQHLIDFATTEVITDIAGFEASSFVEYLRRIEIAPNGHRNAKRRKLRDKGILYILETCRSMFRFGQRHKLVAKDLDNPFSDLSLGGFKVRDSKAIFVFSAVQELAFFNAAKGWAFAINMMLAKTGMRPGELAHLLIEDVDLDTGWASIRNKPDLGWHIKTGRERRVPLIPEVVALLTELIGQRTKGPLFLRMKCRKPALVGDGSAMALEARNRLVAAAGKQGSALTRKQEAAVYRAVWRDSGAVDADLVRTSFMEAARAAALPATCPKSWRHTFATLLQEARVDLLIRQETLGHKPASAEKSALGMTGIYTHTDPKLLHREIERALRLRPQTLSLIPSFSKGEHHGS